MPGIRRAVLFGLLLLAAAGAALAQGFYLKNGDRVVFYGDSITDQRLYTTFTETFVVTRFPQIKVDFVHSGWGGDRVTGGGGGPIDLRLRRDVFAYHPTVMTIMLGMNDGRYRTYDEEIFKTYADGYRHIIESVKAHAPGVRITVIQPSPYDDVTREPNFEGGYNAVMVRYGQFLKSLAQEQQLNLADLNTPVVEALEKAKASDPELARRIVPDRVHPGPGGHLLMAEALLKSWHAPGLVSDVEIDARRKRVVRAELTSVKDLRAGATVSWEQEDQALPMPINSKDSVLMLAVRSSDFVAAMDQQPLKVTGLEKARYALKIDGETAGSFNREELAEGVNLAVLPTPMEQQAAKVHEWTLKHNNIHFARWRQVQVPLADESLEHKQAAMDALDSLEQEIVAAQRAAAEPKAHRFELVPE